LFAATKYAFINAKIRGMKTKLLEPKDFESLIGAKDTHSIIRILQSTKYPEEFSKLSGEISLEKIDRIFTENFIATFESLRMVAPSNIRKFLSVIGKKYEAEVIKSLLRSKYADLPVNEALFYTIPIGVYTEETIRRIYMKPNLKSLIESIPDDGFKAALSDAWRDFERDRNLLSLETALDHYVYNSIFAYIRMLGHEDYPGAYNFYGTEIDLNNINIVLRGKAADLNPAIIQRMIVREGLRVKKEILLEGIRARSVVDAANKLAVSIYAPYIIKGAKKYQQTGNISILERVLDEFLMNRCRLLLARFPFSLETILGFITLKYFETRNIKALIIGKEEKLAPSVIREFLVY